MLQNRAIEVKPTATILAYFVRHRRHSRASWRILPGPAAGSATEVKCVPTQAPNSLGPYSSKRPSYNLRELCCFTGMQLFGGCRFGSCSKLISFASYCTSQGPRLVVRCCYVYAVSNGDFQDLGDCCYHPCLKICGWQLLFLHVFPVALFLRTSAGFPGVIGICMCFSQ